MKGNYDFQIKAAKATLSMALSNKYEAAVLGACPGSGKSTILILILNDFFKLFPNAKCKVLAHNQTCLKSQLIENFTNAHVKPNFTFGLFASNSQVEVGIPVNASKIDSIDLLVIDEAHQYYSAPMVNSIISKHKPKHQILMTGSPSCFINYNNEVDSSYENTKKFGIYFIAASDLVDNDVFSAVDLDVVKAEDSDVGAVYAHAKKQGYDMRKVMWACKTIAQARKINNKLLELGNHTFLSTSHNDASNEQIEAFKKASAGVLIVVGKGVLGFSDESITCLVDMKKSNDLDNRNQLFARVLRKHPLGIKKAYLSVTGVENYNNEVIMLQNLVDLMDREVYVGYSGK